MIENFRVRLGKKAQELREARNCTQKEIASQLGIAQGDLSAFESRGGKLGIAKIVALFDLLGYELDFAEKKTSLTYG